MQSKVSWAQDWLNQGLAATPGTLPGVALTVVVMAWLLYYRHSRKQIERATAQAERDALEDARARAEALAAERGMALDALREALAQRQSELAQIQAEAAAFRERAARVEGLEAELREGRSLLGQAQAEVARLTERLSQEARTAAEKLTLLTEARSALATEFKLLAGEALKGNAEGLIDQHRQSLDGLLTPLKLRLESFQQKVEQAYETEGKERSALKQQLEQLVQLNTALSDDARNLTAALKGSSKSQGLWGELVLERVLEISGLRKGMEYEAQMAYRGEEGERQHPDVVIKLPGGRRLVVDAKVSLVAYERYTSATDDAGRERALSEHVRSVRAHIGGLSEKRYQNLEDQSLDFVLLFIAVEPAFASALSQDEGLYAEAWKRNVLLVSPSTLLFVLRTVAHLWRQEAQNRNAQEIARRGGEFYDKLMGFLVDLSKVGDGLDNARNAFDQARRKLVEGRGNVVRQAELLRELGVKPSKELAKGWEADADTDRPPEPDALMAGSGPQVSDNLESVS